MASKIAYRPYQVSRHERLAFRLKDDQVAHLSTTKRKYHNPALMKHELVMHYSSSQHGLPARNYQAAPQYVGADRFLVVADV